MPLERWRSCGRSRPTPAADWSCRLPQHRLSAITVEGCRGGSLSGAVLLRRATNAVIKSIARNKTIANFAIFRPAFGLPAIIRG